MSNKTLYLDISKDPKATGGSLLPIVYGRVGDQDIETVKIVTSQRDVPFNLTGQSISFEGVTAGGKTKVFDSIGVTGKDLAKGIFEYTFPNKAFAVAGKYARAYFSFVKGNKRATTEDFMIIVLDNADITAEEAATVISEYNKLVKELQELQKKNIAELQKQQTEYINKTKKEFEAIQTKISALQKQIATYETNVTNTANAAIEAIKKAIADWEKGNFYTKPESDNRFAKKTDLTKKNVQLGNVDNYATATQAEAEAGSASDKFMTPLRTKQYLSSRIATQTEAEVGTSSEKLMTPLRSKQHVDKRIATREEAEDGESDTQLATPLSVKQHFDFNLPDSLKSLLNLQSGTLTLTGGNTGTLNWVRIGNLVFCMVNNLNGRSGGGLESSIGSMPFKAKRYLEFLLTSDDRSAMNSSQLSVSTDGAIRWKRSSGFGSNYHGMFFYEAQE